MHSRGVATLCDSLSGLERHAPLSGGPVISSVFPIDLAASVRQRLLNLSRQRGEETNLLLVRYATERLLYRLSLSPFAGQFLLKGAVLFSVWAGDSYRSTLDLDLLQRGLGSAEGLLDTFRSLCTMEVPPDGLEFDQESIRVEEIRERFEYQGQRLKLVARLGKARIPLQVDVGYGDAVTPPPVRAELPVLLDFPKPRLRVYSKETVVAEKFQAMVALDLLNSRMKDFFDVWVLARDFEFQGPRLLRAIAATFKRRKTALPATTPAVFTHLFSKNPNKLRQWQAFLCKSRLGTTEKQAGLTQVIPLLESFLMPPVRALAESEDFEKVWIPGGPWRGS